jgi:hypothetical protein
MKDASKLTITITDEAGNVLKRINGQSLITMGTLAGFGKQIQGLLKVLGIK